MRCYYIVSKTFFNSYPAYFVCSSVDDKFFVIDDLEKYILNGGGISDKIISNFDKFEVVNIKT